MYQDILKDEWFYVYSDDEHWDTDEKVENWCELKIFPQQITTPVASLRGVPFHGLYGPPWVICDFIYGVVSFKESTIEHIVGCFYDRRDSVISILSQRNYWFLDAIKTLECSTFTATEKSWVGWKTRTYNKSKGQKFDLENDRKVYYIFEDANKRIELDFPGGHEYTDIMKLLEFGRKTYTAQKIPRVCERAVCDCEVKCA